MQRLRYGEGSEEEGGCCSGGWNGGGKGGNLDLAVCTVPGTTLEVNGLDDSTDDTAFNGGYDISTGEEVGLKQRWAGR